MATTILSGQLTVTTSPTLIATGVVGASYLYLHAPSGGNAIYIGGSGVTAATGFELHKGTTLEVWLPESGKLYAIVGSSTENLPWLLTGGR
jgi:hypothetical protein